VLTTSVDAGLVCPYFGGCVSPILEQLPALIGVAVGAIATYAVTTLTEGARWRRQQTVRWDERRLAAYVEYANAIKRIISIAVRHADQRGLGPSGVYSGAVHQATDDLAEAEHERTLKWESVLLLANDDVASAGRVWHESVFLLVRIASGLPSEIAWIDAVETASRARRRFYEAARADLGIATTASAERFEWQLARFLRGEAARQRRTDPPNRGPDPDPS
jgi:hypothetical protein